VRIISPSKALETLGTLALVFLALSLYLKIVLLSYIALILLSCGIFTRKPSAFLAAIWLRFSEKMGTLTTQVILTVVFFGVLAPIAFLYRIRRDDPLMIHPQSARKKSCWMERNHSYEGKDLENVW
jgi:hypothetical protein